MRRVLQLRTVQSDIKLLARYRAILGYRLNEVAAALRVLIDDNDIPVVFWYVTDDSVLDRILSHTVFGLRWLRRIDAFSNSPDNDHVCLRGHRGKIVFEVDFSCACSGVTNPTKCKSFRSLCRAVEDEAERQSAIISANSYGQQARYETASKSDGEAKWPSSEPDVLSIHARAASDDLKAYGAELQARLPATLAAAESLRERYDIIENSLWEIDARFEPVRALITAVQGLYLLTGDSAWDKTSDSLVSTLGKPFLETSVYVRNAHTLRSRHIPAHIETAVRLRDFGTCIVCGTARHLQIDHIVPFIQGGEHAENNLRLLCEPCHGRRHMIAFLPSRIDSVDEIVALDAGHLEELRAYIKSGSDPSFIAKYPEPFRTALRRQWQNGGRLNP